MFSKPSAPSRIVIVATLLLLTAGCGHGRPEVDDDASPAPVLTFSDLCYGLCVYQRPPGLPVLTVYADGTTFFSLADDPNLDRSTTISFRTGRIDAEQLDELLDAVEATELSPGHVVERGCQVSEGNDRVVVRGDGAVSVLDTWLDESCLGAPPSFHVDEVRALGETITDIEIATDRPVEPRWAILATPRRAGTAGMTIAPWPGPDPSAFPTTGPYGEHCLVLDDLGSLGDTLSRLNLPEQTGAPTYLVGGGPWLVWGRALLPHESTCEDITATAATIGVDQNRAEM